ncbi:hypothetical protein QFC22_005563 [Naganishia vaughanmartiniae]|uniref:Uncharacterized protein n=1 Tax=Naganishia vaughanmartiniae TaxID=1424756 RepID=A0ACC2WUG7_9TREE|nr:hypothetical protein QFC22_005563 [Naganishia vaughanmartiniae]
MSEAPTHPLLFCMGNPLLDMQVSNGEALLQKYNLKANDAILADENQMGIYDDVTKDYKVTYVAGGAAQNAARAAAYVLPPNHVVYVGAVGKDALAEQLEKANDKEGVKSAYQVVEDDKTGACAVVLTGHDRSLVTTLRAAEKFSPAHLADPTIKSYIDHAKFFYIGGFFLTHGIESALHVAKSAAGRGKVVVLNLSAPFIPQFFKQQLDQLLMYVDILIGNESEAASYAEAQGMAVSHVLPFNPSKANHSQTSYSLPSYSLHSQDSSVAQIATAIANLPKSNASRPRLVIITQGSESTLVASSSPSSSPSSSALSGAQKCNLSASDPNPKTYPVPKLDDSQIVDTNGAGDAFAGGFLGAHVLGKSLDECIEVGHRLGQRCVGQVGPTFGDRVDILKDL